jgi:hypothetical protein
MYIYLDLAFTGQVGRSMGNLRKSYVGLNAGRFMITSSHILSLASSTSTKGSRQIRELAEGVARFRPDAKGSGGTCWG